MDKVVKFPKEKPDECTCDKCQLTDEYLQYVEMTNTKDELKEELRDLVEEAFRLGYRKSIMDDLDNKLELLNHIQSDFNE